MIKINGVMWRVQLVPPTHSFLAAGRREPALGCCDNLTRTICVSNALSWKMIKRVLCHEIVHATMFSYGIDLTFEQEEIAANIMDTYGDEILQVTNIAYDKLKHI